MSGGSILTAGETTRPTVTLKSYSPMELIILNDRYVDHLDHHDDHDDKPVGAERAQIEEESSCDRGRRTTSW